MAEISDKSKQTVDQLSEEELRLEFNKGPKSRFQKEKFSYLKSRLQQIEEQKQQQQQTQQNDYAETQTAIAQKSLNVTVLCAFLAVISILVAIAIAAFSK